MIISRKKFEQELEKARNQILQQNELNCRFREVHERIGEMERWYYNLHAQIDKIDAELHPPKKPMPKRER